jgi:hypothetical protein
VPSDFSPFRQGQETERPLAVDECASGQVEDQTAIDFGIKAKVEVTETAAGITEASLFASAFEQPVSAAREFVRYQAGDQIYGSHGFGLSLAQPGFEHCGHAAQAELAECTF